MQRTEDRSASGAARSRRSAGPRAFTALAAAGAALAAAASASADISYGNFINDAGLSMSGVASKGSDYLMVNPSVGRRAGAVWADAKQNVAGGFELTFEFRIRDKIGGGADGLAFVIQNQSATPLGGSGGAMGYGDNIYFNEPGIANSLAVEFDTWNNTIDWSDPDDRHVSIQSRGLLPNSPNALYSLGWGHAPTDFSDGSVHTAVVGYTPGLMRIYLDGLATPLVTASIDLSALLSLDQGKAWVGFTAATGGAADAESHEVLSWSMTSLVPAPGSAALLLGGGLLAAQRRRHGG